MCRERIGRLLRRMGWKRGSRRVPVPADISRRPLLRAGLPSFRPVLRRALLRLSTLARAAWRWLARTAGRLWAWVAGQVPRFLQPLVRPYINWLQRQPRYVLALLNAWLVLLAVALAILAAFLWMKPATLAQSAAPTEILIQTHDLSEVLYRWLEEQPGVPQVRCEDFETPAQCQRRLASEAEKFQHDFWKYVCGQTVVMQSAVWVKAGDAFPKYNAAAGEFEFAFRMEGEPAGDEKTCIPLRVIALMPEGIITDVWPDQQGPDSPKDPFPHPCLRCTDWKVRVRVDAVEASRWVRKAQADGWRLEMHFRLEGWESPIRGDWGRDASLKADDFVDERRIWLWVDEVRLVVGDEVVRRWGESPSYPPAWPPPK